MQFLLAIAVLIVAAAYASVGLGGGTAYLSLLSFWTIDPDALRPTAWGLNIIVAVVSAYNFHRHGHFDLRDTWHLLIGGAVGAAFGALLPIPDILFHILLSFVLWVVGLRMLLSRDSEVVRPYLSTSWLWLTGLALGFGAGVVSGLVGIGGGVVIGPIVLLLGWFSMKQTAAFTSVYILLTSLSALGSHFISGGSVPWKSFLLLGGAAMLGGFFGSRYGAGKASALVLQRIFSLVVLIAAANLLFGLLEPLF